MNACSRFEEDILLAVDGSLPEHDLDVLESHAAGCRGCARALASARLLEDQLARMELPPLSSAQIDAHLAAVRTRIATPAPRAPRPIPFRWIAAAAAVLALLGAALAFVLSQRDASSAPGIVDAPAVPVRTDPSVRPDAPTVAAAVATATKEPHAGSDSGSDSTLENSPEIVAATGPETEDARRDAERLALARASVATALAAAAIEPDIDPSAFAADVEAHVDALVRGDWPLVRIVEGFARDDDDELARRALRYLAARGDALSSSAVRAATRRPELATEAWRALVRVQPDRIDLLGSEPAKRDAADLALRSIVARKDRAGAESIEDALRRIDPSALEASDARPEELLSALAGLGPVAIPSLLRLADQGRPSRSQVLDALANTEGAAEQLAALVRERRPTIAVETLLAAFARIPPTGPRADEACAWIAARVGEPRTRSQALVTLARCGSPAALGLLSQMTTRDPERDVDDAVVALIVLHPEAAVELARQNGARGRKRDQQDLLETLSSAGIPSAIPGLIALAEGHLLDTGDRRLALLACGVSGSEDDAAQLVDAFDRTRERELRAAILVAMQSLGGPELVARVLADLPPRAADAIRAILAEPDLAQRGVHAQARIARELTRHMAAIRP